MACLNGDEGFAFVAVDAGFVVAADGGADDELVC